MSAHRKHRAPLVFSVVCLVALAACGDDDDDLTADTAALATTAASPGTEPPTTEADNTEPVDTEPATTDAAEPDTTEPAASGAGASPEEWDAIVQAANEEGKVTVYSVMLPNQNESLEAGFEAAYPEIDMEVVRLLGADIDARLEAERETGAEGGDLGAHINYQWVVESAAAGDLVEMVGPEARGPNWEGTPWNVDGLYQYSTFQLLGIGCNTELVDACPTSYQELLDPQYEGQIGAVEPGHQVLMDFWVFLEEQLGGEAGLEQLRELNPVFYASAVPAQQGLAAGEVSVTSYATAQLLDDAAAGAPVEFVIPEPAWSPPILSYIVRWATHPNAAQLVLDYMASREGQEAVAINGASALPDIPGTLAEIENVSPLNVVENTAEWAAPLQDHWRDIFGR